MSVAYSLARAGRWFLRSGIQAPSGGVSRYYDADANQYKPISTEISGYFASALVFLFEQTGDEEYLEAAKRAADFLCDHAWDEPLQAFPFEHPSRTHTYFFDCGIIVRGLLAVWRVTKDQRLFDVSLAASRAMAADFHSGTDYHPILGLPGKEPTARTGHWSKSPGCYQLKSALAWLEVGDADLRAAYFEMLGAALESSKTFLTQITERSQIMDRLHAWCYYLEGLTPVRDQYADELKAGIEVCGAYLQDIAPEFARSDVYAQLMRAKGCAGVDLQNEANDLRTFQADSDDPRLDGSFLFGRRNGVLVQHANPVSTAFAIQALELKSPCQPI